MWWWWEDTLTLPTFLKDIPFTLSGCGHSFRGCFLQWISTRQAGSVQANFFLQVHLCSSAFLLHKHTSNHCCSTGWAHPYHIQSLSHCIWAWASWRTGSRPLWWSNSSIRNSTSTNVFPTRYTLGRHSLGRAPFSEFLAMPPQRNWDHTPSGSLDHHHTKRTHVCSPEV